MGRQPRRPPQRLAARDHLARAGGVGGSAVRGSAGAVRLRIEVMGGEEVAPGPVIVLIRHASIVDNLLPAKLIARRHGIRLRYVLKRELLADPCLDIAGRRLPNYFVRRGTGEAQELERVRALAHGLGTDEGVLIYPRGPASRRSAVPERSPASPNATHGAGGTGRAHPPPAAAPPRRRRGAARRRTGRRCRPRRPSRPRRATADVGRLAGRPRRARGQGPRDPGAAVRGARAGPDRTAWLYDLWQEVDDWLDAGASGSWERAAG